MTDNAQSSIKGGRAALAVDLIQGIIHLHNQWSGKHKRANILIAGKTGVGKTTLINTVFRDNMADTGMGKPVTQHIKEISKPGLPLTILDSKGLELADFETIKSDLMEAVRSRQGEDAETYVHLAWICISEESARIEDAELELALALKNLGLTIIVAITKASNFKDNEFQKIVREQFGSTASNVILTRALEEELLDDEDNRIGMRLVKGIDELLYESYKRIPESQRQSFANSLSLKNKKSIEVKRSEAALAIGVATTAAGAAAATPIPFSDAVALVPIQVAMIMAISKTFGMTVSKDNALPIVTSLIGVTGTTLVGRTIVSTLLKFIPGLGSIAGGVVAATTAIALTKGLGDAYANVLAGIAERGEALDLATALKHLKEKYSLT